MPHTIAFIGAGNMGGAIVRAVCRTLDPKEVLVYEPDAAKGGALAQETGCALAERGALAAEDARYVVLCVKPQILPGVVRDLTPALKRCAGAGGTLVSIAAGVALPTLAVLLAEGGVSMPTVRIMPNTPAAIGKGTLLLAPAADVAETGFAELCRILAPCGLLERVTEAQLDLGSAISGCGPAYVYLMIEALADGGVEIGLPRALAQRLAANTLAGAASMVLESGTHPGALKDAVCSPGGTTIAGVAELERRGFRSAAARAVVAAYHRNCELSQSPGK